MRILHLYPNLMNLYGDHANVTLLKKHLEDQGVEVIVDRREVYESFDPDSYDLIYMGSGTEKNLMVALDELNKYKYYLKKYVEEGKVLFLTGNAMEVAASRIDGRKALDLVGFDVVTTEKRYTGDVIVKNSEIGEVVGFINRSTLIEGGLEHKLFDYDFRYEGLKDNEYEGYRYRNLFGTHIIGPVLVKNPCFMSFIVSILMKGKYHKIAYPYEEDAYQTTLRELKKRK
ncbi:MAG: hypothetical protein K5908_06260 [Erysipelotrichaceae bacterium]|nr:hypothetical protein [Erysipelotrichaceae bacterium]